MHKKLLILFVSLLSLKSYGQKPEELMEKWVSVSPIEKVYLCFDRENYVAGETAFFQAYLVSDWQPDTISTSLYIELLNDQNEIEEKKVFPVFIGCATGQVELPESLVSGYYTIRAFTATMMNHSPDFVYRKKIFVYGKMGSQKATSIPTPSIQLQFFPEGGNLVSNLNATVAFKAINEYGLPVNISGKIKNSKGIELNSFNSYHDGMGMFDLKPEKGENYYAQVNGVDSLYALPDIMEKGIVLSLLQQPDGYFFELQQQTSDPAFVVAYMVGQMQHHVVFSKQFGVSSAAIQGTINTKNLNSGILQVTFFNNKGMPLAERLCFVSNGEYILPAMLQTDTLDFLPGAKNRFSILLNDTVQGNIAISVTDADYLHSTSREENIYTSLLLTSDIKGYVHNPSWYFTAATDSAEIGMDLLMMTNGWRRFRWTEIAAQKTEITFDKSFITLSGRIFLKGTKKPFADKQVLLMITGLAGSKERSASLLSTDKEGRFSADSLLFFGRCRLLFIDVRGKKSQYIDVLMDGDSLNRTFLLPPGDIMPALMIMDIANGKKWQMDFDAIMKANGIMLEGVTVKAKKKTAVEQLDDNYTTGMFSGTAFAQRVIDLVNTDEAMVQENIFEYLKSRVPGIQVVDPVYSSGQPALDPRLDTDKYRVYYRQMPSVSSMGSQPMTLYLDEIETDANVIATLTASEIALIKVFSSFAAASGGGAGGALAIYTKKGEDRRKVKSLSNLQNYNGYSVIKEFYAPDYKEIKPGDKPDNRITIDWRPSIFVNSINPRIPLSFYNNDRTKSFKVVVEGMTTSGKMIWLEKTIAQ
ncbi:MAG: hypothetical protein IPM85_08990 [Chitinophagaceae bacterium]|nr:hypothetical protein [Chitinophagaceae bacterium]